MSKGVSVSLSGGEWVLLKLTGKVRPNLISDDKRKGSRY